ncbi:F0F1 ATP synthase subunit delta [Patescibacteria group bacterium]|nr:F0F1 ATP synthase subunit delta [Patescibacteria group bacterium]
MPRKPKITGTEPKNALLELKNELETQATAVVITPISLTAKQKQEITDVLESHFGNTLRIENRVEKTYIAGMYIRVGDQVIDLTLRSRIDTLRERLLP